MRIPVSRCGYWLLAGLALCPIGSTPARAELRRMSFDELVRRSELIVCGKVVELRCYRGPFLGRGQLIFTDVTVEITEKIAGEMREKTVTVQVPGGRIGEQFLVCPDAPKYRKGERVLLFLRRYNGCCWNTGWAHGKYSLAASSDEIEASPASPAATATSQHPAVGSDGLRTRVRGRPRAPISKNEELDDVRQRIRDLRRELERGRTKR